MKIFHTFAISSLFLVLSVQSMTSQERWVQKSCEPMQILRQSIVETIADIEYYGLEDEDIPLLNSLLSIIDVTCEPYNNTNIIHGE